MKLWLQGGYVLDAQTGQPMPRDLLLADGKIVKIAPPLQEVEATRIPLERKLIVPGFIDMHVHLRQPGFEYKETIATGTRAAAKGGYSAVACMPNTRPVLDTPEWIRFVQETAAKEGHCRVYPLAAITRGERGEELTDMRALKEAGALGFSDDGRGVQSAGLMRQAMVEAARLQVPLLIHAEDESLAQHGCMHAGEVSRRLGLPGIPSSAEAVQVARDILLAAETGAHLHVCHISAAESVDLVRFAKEKGWSVTAEVAPHHLLLTDEQIDGTDANWKVNPPLRSEKDRLACVAGLIDGTIDMVATDHAPHAVEEKTRPFAVAPFGFVGLETAFPLLYTHLVESGKMRLSALIRAFSTHPAKVFGLPGGELREGAVADITVLDLQEEKTIDPQTFSSKGRNTPFRGWRVKGWPVLTITAGLITYRAGEGRGEGDESAIDFGRRHHL